MNMQLPVLTLNTTMNCKFMYLCVYSKLLVDFAERLGNLHWTHSVS